MRARKWSKKVTVAFCVETVKHLPSSSKLSQGVVLGQTRGVVQDVINVHEVMYFHNLQVVVTPCHIWSVKTRQCKKVDSETCCECEHMTNASTWRGRTRSNCLQKRPMQSPGSVEAYGYQFQAKTFGSRLPLEEWEGAWGGVSADAQHSERANKIPKQACCHTPWCSSLSSWPSAEEFLRVGR